jgi:KDO2-lipid IV(A) lauroyltransferase
MKTWKDIPSVLLYAWVKVHALLPLGVLYALSDVAGFFIYRVLRYRLGVVRENMQAAFPEKTRRERIRLERRFYRHFSDSLAEIVKMGHISLRQIRRRARVINPELIDSLMDRGHSCLLLVMAHYGNWEWFTAATGFFRDTRMYQVYRPLKSRAFDHLFSKLRTQFGAFGIKKDETLRKMIRLKKEKTRSVVVFLADQSPSRFNLHYWTSFLNQDSAVYTGPERIAKKLDLPVVFVDAKRERRGYYAVEMQLITDVPQDTPDCFITERYARMAERCILRDPAYWLWTHKRWKYKQQQRS